MMNQNDLSTEAIRKVLDSVYRQGQAITIADAPPGAGKSTLAEKCVAVGVQKFNLRVGLIAPRNEQIYDLTRRLLRNYRGMAIHLLKAADRDLPEDLSINLGITSIITSTQNLTVGNGVVIGTAAKFFASSLGFPSEYFDLLVCDEAYNTPGNLDQSLRW